ncbi:MAG: hypothetical protein IPF42_16920 [Candidatus Microthrix sp.]|nr:hypothetical protein [Candidatus Microthrix sp.]
MENKYCLIGMESAVNAGRAGHVGGDRVVAATIDNWQAATELWAEWPHSTSCQMVPLALKDADWREFSYRAYGKCRRSAIRRAATLQALPLRVVEDGWATSAHQNN